MGTTAAVTDRGALYYPFIHIRDDNWLKATLLCFPFVDRMVPDTYQVNDGPAAKFFAGTQGRFGQPLLGRRDLADPATEHARSVLLENLKEDLAARDLAARFSRQAARTGPYANGENAFQIHEYKLGGAFINFLESHGLAWDPPIPIRDGARWLAVHPTLGEAIMSTNAVALAQAHDLEIVTSDGAIHQSLLGTTPETVYDILVRRQVFGMPRPAAKKVNDLMRFVILSSFDLEKVSFEEIAELNLQRQDLSALKTALLSQIEDIGPMPDKEQWQHVVAQRAKDVVAEWRSRTSIVSMFTHMDAKEIADEFQSTLQDVAPSVVAGGVTGALIGALPGLAVGVVFGAVHLARKWQESRQPYHFLSRLARKGARPKHVLEGSVVQ
jgi:hypothetical protein